MVTIHALLHIADYIEATGPVWTSWAFAMERFCGRLQPAVKSRRYAYASIAKYILDDARLTQVQLVHNLTGELLLRRGANIGGRFKDTACKQFLILLQLASTHLNIRRGLRTFTPVQERSHRNFTI